MDKQPQDSFIKKRHQSILSRTAQESPKSPLDGQKPTTEIEREIAHVQLNFGEDIDSYLRQVEQRNLTTNALEKHKITPVLRSRMVDWMIEVMTNFRCDDQTFFVAICLMDRYFQAKQTCLEVNELHVTGVAAMFIASKYEDIYPLKMKDVYEKIAHKRLSHDRIKQIELEILIVTNYNIQAPTVLEFLKVYL